MPVAVVALAASSFAAGATAFAAATTLAATVAAGATMVGSALTIVGAVTGNQKLTKIGAVVGLAGSLGTMAANAASAGSEVASTAGNEAAKDAATSAASDTSGAAADVTGAMQTSPVTMPDASAIQETGDAARATSGAAVQPVGAIGASQAPAAGAAGQSVMGGQNAADYMKSQIAATTAKAADNPLSASLDSGSTFSPNAANAYDPGATTVGKSATFNAFQPNTSASNGNLLGAIESNSAYGPGATSASLGLSDPSKMAQLQQWVRENPDLAKIAATGISAAAGALVPSQKDKEMMALYKAQTDAIKRRALWGSGRTA